MHLIGVYECKLDVKGRLMLPKSFKKQLLSSINSPFILKRSVFHKCLELFPVIYLILLHIKPSGCFTLSYTFSIKSI